jgi:hypothetical protein
MRDGHAPTDRYGHREGARNAAGLMAASAHDCRARLAFGFLANPTLQTLCRRGERLIKQKPHRRPIFRARCVLGLPRQKLKPHNKRLSHVVRGHRMCYSVLLVLIERFRNQPNAEHRLFGLFQKQSPASFKFRAMLPIKSAAYFNPFQSMQRRGP